MDKDITTSRLEEYVELQKESFNAVEAFYLKLKQAYEDHSQESLEAALNTGEENLEKTGRDRPENAGLCQFDRTAGKIKNDQGTCGREQDLAG